jgi:hypothetical protein
MEQMAYMLMQRRADGYANAEKDMPCTDHLRMADAAILKRGRFPPPWVPMSMITPNVSVPGEGMPATTTLRLELFTPLAGGKPMVGAVLSPMSSAVQVLGMFDPNTSKGDAVVLDARRTHPRKMCSARLMQWVTRPRVIVPLYNILDILQARGAPRGHTEPWRAFRGALDSTDADRLAPDMREAIQTCLDLLAVRLGEEARLAHMMPPPDAIRYTKSGNVDKRCWRFLQAKVSIEAEKETVADRKRRRLAESAPTTPPVSSGEGEGEETPAPPKTTTPPL